MLDKLNNDLETRKSSSWLLDYKEDVYSQAGEDGVIKKILETIPGIDNWCVEFGAWDGIFLSNTANLIKNYGYSAVLIEGSSSKFKELKKNYSSNPNVFPINAFVGYSAENNLDDLLENTPIGKNYDLLSIDVDGNDYHIWKAIKLYNPKVVVVEFNQSIPTEVRFVQEANPSVSQGASLLSLVELGKQKGYELISVLHCNAIFVKEEYFSLFGINDNLPSALRTSLEDVTYLFSGYDGKIMLSGSKKLPWHGVEIVESNIQILPFMLHKFPENYSKHEKYLWRGYLFLQKLIKNPKVTLKNLFFRFFGH